MNDAEIADLKIAIGDALTVVSRVQAYADNLDFGQRGATSQLVRQAFVALDAALDSLTPAADEPNGDDD